MQIQIFNEKTAFIYFSNFIWCHWYLFIKTNTEFTKDVFWGLELAINFWWWNSRRCFLGKGIKWIDYYYNRHLLRLFFHPRSNFYVGKTLKTLAAPKMLLDDSFVVLKVHFWDFYLSIPSPFQFVNLFLEQFCFQFHWVLNDSALNRIY